MGIGELIPEMEVTLIRNEEINFIRFKENLRLEGLSHSKIVKWLILKAA